MIPGLSPLMGGGGLQSSSMAQSGATSGEIGFHHDVSTGDFRPTFYLPPTQKDSEDTKLLMIVGVALVAAVVLLKK